MIEVFFFETKKTGKKTRNMVKTTMREGMCGREGREGRASEGARVLRCFPDPLLA
jgi:hypothetical protein